MSRTYILEVEEQVIRGQCSSSEEIICHPTILIVTRHLLMSEDVHKQLYNIHNTIDNNNGQDILFRLV